MRLSILLVLGCAAALISGCADMPSGAAVDDRSASWQKGVKSTAQKPQAEESAPAADPPGYYTVRRGDTLSRIAQQFNQPWRDIADWNSLANPNDIKVGQQLRVIPPEGARMASVPMDTGMEVRPLDTAASPQPSQVKPQPGQAQAASAQGGRKTGPQGTKVAYSEQALSDFQRTDPSSRLTEPARKPTEIQGAGRFVWPTEGRLIRGYDAARKGIDIAGQLGQPIVAVGDGTVLYAKNMRGYGNLVIVDHSEGLVSAYAHNQTILVKEGQTVTRGQRIAEMGSTDADSVRLHFEIRQLGKPVDPTSFLPSR